MDRGRAGLARIAVDLGLDELEDGGGRAKWWRSPFRRKPQNFFASFATDGVGQLETYLAKWTAYDDYLARRAGESHEVSGGPSPQTRVGVSSP
jgi:hypothetical protein